MNNASYRTDLEVWLLLQEHLKEMEHLCKRWKIQWVKETYPRGSKRKRPTSNGVAFGQVNCINQLRGLIEQRRSELARRSRFEPLVNKMIEYSARIETLKERAIKGKRNRYYGSALGLEWINNFRFNNVTGVAIDANKTWKDLVASGCGCGDGWILRKAVLINDSDGIETFHVSTLSWSSRRGWISDRKQSYISRCGKTWSITATANGSRNSCKRQLRETVGGLI